VKGILNIPGAKAQVIPEIVIAWPSGTLPPMPRGIRDDGGFPEAREFGLQGALGVRGPGQGLNFLIGEICRLLMGKRGFVDATFCEQVIFIGYRKGRVVGDGTAAGKDQNDLETKYEE